MCKICMHAWIIFFYRHASCKDCVKMNTIWPLFWSHMLTFLTLILLLALVQTGDKSGEVTARMNLSDLRLVVGLKSNSNIYPNIFCNTNTNSSPLPVSYQGYSNFTGTSDSTVFFCSQFFCFQDIYINKFWNMQLHLWIALIAYLFIYAHIRDVKLHAMETLFIVLVCYIIVVQSLWKCCIYKRLATLLNFLFSFQGSKLH